MDIISVLISTYNGENDIRLLLNSIKNQRTVGYELEVIVRDDSSIDRTVEIIEEEYRWVKLLYGQGNPIGFVAGNNIAAEHAAGDILCCVNQDTVLHPDFFAEAMAVFSSDPEVYGINTNMIMPWIMSLSSFVKSDREDIPCYEFQLAGGGYIQYRPVERKIRITDFMSGGGFLLRKVVVDQRGFLFDPSLYMYCEDTDLSLRLRKNGMKILYCPNVVIYHNQQTKDFITFGIFFRFLRITSTRFTVLTRHNSPLSLILNYPLYLLGIVQKTFFLGLSPNKTLLASCFGCGVAFCFLLIFPYWFFRSFIRHYCGKS